MREDNLSKGKKVAAILESLGTNLSAVVNIAYKANHPYGEHPV
jgi:hypothetical protein